jgi:rhamnosyltransferase
VSKVTRLAVYAHFGESPKVARYVLYFLKELGSLGFEICFVSNSPVSIKSQSEISTLSQKFIQRENTGYDFSMWQAGLAEYDLSKVEELLLTNSSIIGPLQPVAPLWQNSSVKQCDFWGLTDNDEVGRHLQTYFMVFRRQVIQAACFMDFWRSVLPLKDKQQVIRNYEIGLTRWLEENGFKWKAVFAQERMWSLFLSRRSFAKKIGDWFYNRGLPRGNTTILLPGFLLQCGMPFLKATLLRESPFQVSPKIAFELLETSNLPVEILEELRLKKQARKSASAIDEVVWHLYQVGSQIPLRWKIALLKQDCSAKTICLVVCSMCGFSFARFKQILAFGVALKRMIFRQREHRL